MQGSALLAKKDDGVEQLVYIVCEMTSFARDLEMLQGGGDQGEDCVYQSVTEHLSCRNYCVISEERLK